MLSGGVFAGVYLGLPLLIGSAPLWLIPVACVATIATLITGSFLTRYFQYRSRQGTGTKTDNHRTQWSSVNSLTAHPQRQRSNTISSTTSSASTATTFHDAQEELPRQGTGTKTDDHRTQWSSVNSLTAHPQRQRSDTISSTTSSASTATTFHDAQEALSISDQTIDLSGIDDELMYESNQFFEQIKKRPLLEDLARCLHSLLESIKKNEDHTTLSQGIREFLQMIAPVSLLPC